MALHSFSHIVDIILNPVSIKLGALFFTKVTISSILLLNSLINKYHLFVAEPEIFHKFWKIKRSFIAFYQF